MLAVVVKFDRETNTDQASALPGLAVTYLRTPSKEKQGERNGGTPGRSGLDFQRELKLTS
jgi:hypothetical protein